MGYYSTIAFQVMFPDEPTFAKFTTAMGDTWKEASPYFDVWARGFQFQVNWVKWPLAMSSKSEWAPEHHVFEEARRRNEEHEEHPDYIPSSGYFARIGEELDDVEEEYWDGNHPDLVYGFDLGGLKREVRLTTVAGSAYQY